MKYESENEIIGIIYHNIANAYYKKEEWKTSDEFNNMALELVIEPSTREDILELKEELFKTLKSPDKFQ